LTAQRRLDEALDAFRRAGELARPGSSIANRLPGLIGRVEEEIRLAGRLIAVLDGKDKPTSPAEGLGFARLCQQRKWFAAAARLWAEAFAADRKLAEDMNAQHRYNAACAAALAGAGRGEDPPTDEAEKVRWRKQAVAWLKADLAHWGQQVEGGKAESKALGVRTLRHWKEDPELAGLRDEAALKALPEDEQTACHALWAEVDAVLARARGGRP
jgi:hypothetical protein